MMNLLGFNGYPIPITNTIGQRYFSRYNPTYSIHRVLRVKASVRELYTSSTNSDIILPAQSNRHAGKDFVLKISKLQKTSKKVCEKVAKFEWTSDVCIRVRQKSRSKDEI